MTLSVLFVLRGPRGPKERLPRESKISFWALIQKLSLLMTLMMTRTIQRRMQREMKKRKGLNKIQPMKKMMMMNLSKFPPEQQLKKGRMRLKKILFHMTPLPILLLHSWSIEAGDMNRWLRHL